MGVFLGQLPPAELARLKAELAETLIAHFCYPRFFDYRTESLRTRPVDRGKRQEVWLYLSSVDFTTWNRVDLLSPDFQHYIERLLIHFVQRNRSFFGEQGRKRMPDIRMLIGSSASSIAQGLRGHLSGNPQSNPPFGSPRSVASWSTTNITGRPEPTWEQIVSPTLLLQQQIQEARGEIKPAPPQSEARSAVTTARRTSRVQPISGNITNGIEHQATVQSQVPVSKSKPQPNLRRTTSLPDSKSAAPLHPGSPAAIVPPAALKVDPGTLPVEPSFAPKASIAAPVKSSGVTAPPLPTPEKALPPAPPAAIQPRVLPHAAPALAAHAHEKSSPLVIEEDLAIFEEMRHQLIVWLRIETIRSGLDISNQGPSQLLEMLRKQANFDETRLQVVSTLLNLANQVIKNGQASLFDYKQALMFHLMHTRR